MFETHDQWLEMMDQPSTLKCPKCGDDMEKVHFHRFVVDRCTGCKGLWLSAMDREYLSVVRDAESIDTGPRHVEDRSAKVKIDCPVCHTPMIRMVDHKQPHIWYESCPVCYGVFHDAGEFRDTKSHNIVDFIRDLFRQERV
jgi:Zn-finger nucleic acid-binding protein